MMCMMVKVQDPREVSSHKRLCQLTWNLRFLSLSVTMISIDRIAVRVRENARAVASAHHTQGVLETATLHVMY